MRRTVATALAISITAALPAGAQTCAADWLQPRTASSIGDPALAPAMDVLRADWRRLHPGEAPPLVWRHASADAAIGALMYETADLAPIARAFTAAEIAPYEHQYHGDMIKAPTAVRIGSVGGRAAFVAVNKRPDSPLPARIADFLGYALSPEGQASLARVPGFAPLAPSDVAAERAKLGGGYLAALDPALPTYRPARGLAGAIRSDGSDGMKDLMDGWECRFAALQPGVHKGERWEHPGTLNGFHALLAGEADIAPMGRELWPEERAAWQGVLGTPAPVEIAVARGGFDTPQRTTAQAVFVHPDNPLASLTMTQLAAIFGANPTITRWGQLGLTGAWANRPIHLRTPPRVAPNSMSMQMMVLHGRPWAAGVVEAPIADTAKALLDDPAAIGFGGLEEGDPKLKVLAIAPADGAAPVPLDGASASSGRYPLTRFMYIRLAPGRPSPQVAAFLRYVLSREGQERVRYSGYYPLTAAEARAERARVDQAAGASAR